MRSRSPRVDQSIQYYTLVNNAYLKIIKDMKHDLQGIGSQFTDTTPGNYLSPCGQSSTEASVLAMSAALSELSIRKLSDSPIYLY